MPTDANPNKKEWKERGVGTLRLNVSDLEPEDDPLIQMPAKDEDDAASGKKTSGPAPPKARLVMRADGSQRVILNSSVQKELRFGTPEGERPNSMQFLFQGTWEGQMQLLTLRVSHSFTLSSYFGVFC